MRDDMFDWPVDTGMIALVNGDRGPKTDLERTWAKFHQENPAVFMLFSRFADEIINRGHDHYSSDAILHRIRWHTDVETTSYDFKITNNHTPYYSRFWMEKNPQHEGFFRTKSIRQA